MEIQKEKNLESWDYFVPVPCLSRTKYILLIVLLSVGCFIISIDGQFVFDDSEAIVNNKDVKQHPLESCFIMIFGVHV
ncbi:protein O-mannosyl-transferase TMTC4-like [Lycorma delicatula]|uniref:protein O-mannosyl-transferase TMTC4-like n=1 Tax=Lycorma delicatula TaxID=130591 RepID=UPI003F512F25